MSLLGAWLVPGGFTVFCQLSLPGRRGPLGPCRAVLASWAVGVGEPVGCFGIHLAVIHQPLHQRWMGPSQRSLGRGCSIGGRVSARWGKNHRGASARVL